MPAIPTKQKVKATKEIASELNGLNLRVPMAAKRFSSSNQKIETELKNSADKFTAFENSVDERQNSLEESFLEKLQQNDDKISLLSADTQKKMSELALDLENKNNNTD